jgi:hypothetical protein
MKKRILFLLKDRHYSPSKGSYGLINSASQVAEFLTDLGNTCEVITVNDSNGIDKECFRFKPDVVILEALWVTAHKLHELMEIKRYHHIQWIIRVHSDIGYLSTETKGLKHLNDYIHLIDEMGTDKITISVNNEKFAKALSNAMDYKFTYLPNIITTYKVHEVDRRHKEHIDIGCFGALRLLKNQCFQAICAIEAANRLGKELHFHITPSKATDVDPVLMNLEQLFKGSKHSLIIHEWMDTKDFHKLIRKMDIGMQLSYTESFNIVAADFVNNDKLILVSDAVSWLPSFFKASTTDYTSVVNKILSLYYYRNNRYVKLYAKRSLVLYNIDAKKEWKNYLKKI